MIRSGVLQVTRGIAKISDRRALIPAGSFDQPGDSLPPRTGGCGFRRDRDGVSVQGDQRSGTNRDLLGIIRTLDPSERNDLVLAGLDQSLEAVDQAGDPALEFRDLCLSGLLDRLLHPFERGGGLLLRFAGLLQSILSSALLGFPHLFLKALFPGFSSCFPQPCRLTRVDLVQRGAAFFEFFNQIIGVVRQLPLLPRDFIQLPTLLGGQFGTITAHGLFREFTGAFLQPGKILRHLLNPTGDHPGVLTTVKKFRQVGQFGPDLILRFDRVSFGLRRGIGWLSFFRLGRIPGFT